MATTAKKPAAKKAATTKKATPANKATTVKKAAPAKKTTAVKKTTAAKKTTSSATSLKLTATEKKLVELYRDASAATKKEAMEVLKADKKPNDSLIEAVLANKDLAKTLNTLFKKK